MGSLSPEQRAVIEREDWHAVVAYWFVGGTNVRLVFNDGGSFTLFVDGESDDYVYDSTRIDDETD